jgi:DNA-binding CsgD family transcriptional regulator
VLLGRARELAALDERLVQAQPVVVVGEAGIGKTTLVREGARSTGRVVYEGGGLATLSWHSYLPITRALGRQMPPGDPVAVATDVVTSVNGGLLVIDDLQWADHDTLDLIGHIAGEVVMLAAVRRGDPGAARALDATTNAGFVVLELDGVAEEDAREIALQENPGIDETDLADLLVRARGNPLLLRELVTGDQISPSLTASLRARLQRIRPPARDALCRLALLGRPAPARLIGPGAAELCETGLAFELVGAVELRHAVLGEAVLEHLSDAERRCIHTALARDVDAPGEAARHYLAADDRGCAYEAAMAAFEQADRPGDRARHLAVAAASFDGADADALRLRAAGALIDVGDATLVDELLAAVASTKPLVLAEVELLRARHARGLGDSESSNRHIEAGLELAAGTRTPVEAQLLLERVELLLWDPDAKPALDDAFDAAELAGATTTETARAHALLGRALTVQQRAEAFDHFETAIELARASGQHDVELDAMISLCWAHEASRELPQGRAVAEAARLRAHELRLGGWEQAAAHMALHARLGLDGPSEELVEEMQRLLTHAPRGFGLSGDQERSELAIALAELGRFAEARAVLEAMEPQSRWGRWLETYTCGELALLTGRPAEALRLAEQAASELEYGRGWARLTSAWSLVDLDRTPTAEAESGAAPLAAPTIEALRDLMTASREREAERRLDELALAWDELEVIQARRCRWAAAEAARRGGMPDRAAERLLALEEDAQALRLEPLLRRIHRSLRLIGVHRAVRSQRENGGVTAREREVLALVAKGLTSVDIARRLGLARSTVDAQIRSAMRKTGASSRIQAAALALSVT